MKLQKGMRARLRRQSGEARKGYGRQAEEIILIGASEVLPALEAAIIMLHALEQEKGSELLPGKLLIGGEDDPGTLEAKAALSDHFFESCAPRKMKVFIQLVVDGAHAAGFIQVMVELLAGTGTTPPARPGCEGVQVLPAETGGELPEDTVEEEAVGGSEDMAAIYPSLIQVVAEGGDKGGNERKDHLPIFGSFFLYLF
jgi:hypothetical protein